MVGVRVMLFGGNSGTCGGCGCKSCQECTRGCTEPHTGTAFETVYTLYFEGAEAGNPGDGYLEAIGDVDTSDPYDGMDGNGPWEQIVSGTFTLQKSTTRYPCRVTVSFWRSNFVLGAATIPAPSAALTSEKMKVTNSTASEGPIVFGGEILEPGQSYEFNGTGLFPLVPGAGDQSDADPRRSQGTAIIAAMCDNDFVSFEIKATINWNVKKRQHVLYGLVRECYEDPDGPNPCAAVCQGSSVPDIIYVKITNFALAAAATFYSSNVPGVNGTYALDREAGYCQVWLGPVFGVDCNNRKPPPSWRGSHVDTNVPASSPGDTIALYDMSIGLYAAYTASPYVPNLYDGSPINVCSQVLLRIANNTLPELCGTGVLASGQSAAGLAYVYLNGNAGSVETIACTFDWEISA